MLGPNSTEPTASPLTFEGVFSDFFSTNPNTIEKQDSKRSLFLPTAFSPSKHKQKHHNESKTETNKPKRYEQKEKKKKRKTDLGDFCRGDPYNDNSTDQEQTSPISPTHNESNKTHNEKLKKQPKIYVGSLRSQSSVTFPLPKRI